MKAVKIKAHCGWEIIIAETAEDVRAGSGFFILMEDVQKIDNIVKEKFGGKIQTIKQAKELLSVGLIKIK